MPKSRRRTPGAGTSFLGSCRLALTLSSGYDSYPLDAVIDTRTAEMSVAWLFFRYTRLRYRILCDCVTFNTIQVDFALGYHPEINAGSVPYTSVIALRPCAHFSPIVNSGLAVIAPQSSPSDWVNVPRSILLGTPMMWFRTIGGTEDLFTQQGVLLTRSTYGSDSGTLLFELQYTVEYRGATDTTLELLRSRIDTVLQFHGRKVLRSAIREEEKSEQGVSDSESSPVMIL